MNGKMMGIGGLMKESVHKGMRNLSSKRDESFMSGPRKKRLQRSALALKRVRKSEEEY